MSDVPKETLTLGERLRSRREFLGWSVDDLSRETSIPVKYIRALEDDNYSAFSAKVYGLGFLKKALAVLSSENADEFLQEFSREWDVRHYRNPKETLPLPQNRGPEPYLTPRRLGIVSAFLLFLLLLGFLGIRFGAFLSAPKITLEEPKNFIAVSEPAVQLKGRVEKESRLTVNGREIMLDERGNFDETLELAPGVNALEFLIKDRFGKETRAMRYVLVK